MPDHPIPLPEINYGPKIDVTVHEKGLTPEHLRVGSWISVRLSEDDPTSWYRVVKCEPRGDGLWDLEAVADDGSRS